MHLTIMIGRSYSQTPTSLVPFLNSPEVVSQHEDNTFGNVWEMSDEDVEAAKNQLPWFAAMCECPTGLIPVSLELLEEIMISPEVEEWEHFNRWFCFWMRYGSLHFNSFIQID